MSDSDRARELLKLIAEKMYTKSAECHVKGMTWANQSARVSQFGLIASDVEVKEFLRLLIEDGMVEMVEGEPVLVEFGEPTARVDIVITSQGGDS